jgi:hypothetical protein
MPRRSWTADPRSLQNRQSDPAMPVARLLTGIFLVLWTAGVLAAEPGDKATAKPPAAPTQAAKPAAPSPPAQTSSEPAGESPPGAAPGTEPEAHRLREGTHITNHLGHFRQSGDALSFVDQDGREMGALPNLNLERILRALKTVEEPESVSWSVSGVVTEFSGRNFLLINRAVFKSATPPPAPDAVQQ